MCARRDGQTLAVIELQSAPAASYPTIERILDGGGTADDALRAQAVEFQRIFAEDRPIGCGPDYTVAPFGPTSTTVAGHRGVVYGFDGKADGRHAERALQFGTIVGDIVHLIGTTAVDDGSCMDDGELGDDQRRPAH